MEHWGQVAVFDLETTGIDVDTARIVSACVAVLASDGAVISRWDWLADPGIDIPDGASAVHGITTERAQVLGRSAQVVIGEITQTLRVLFGFGIPLVVYNAPYDLTLLDRECRRHFVPVLENPTPVIDPLVIDKAVDRYRKGKRTLEVTAALYGVSLDDAHDAGSDAIAAGRVAQALGRKFPDDLDVTLPDLHGRQEVWYAEQAAHFQSYIRTVKGDADYIADVSWPVREALSPSSFIDTQPIPAPAPRPSLTVPVYDLYGTGVLALPQLQARPAPTPPRELEIRQEVRPQPPLDGLEPGDSDDDVEVRETVAEAVSDAISNGSITIGEVHIDKVEVNIEVTPEREDGDTAPVSRARPTVLRIAAGIITDATGRTLLVRKRGTSSFMQAGGKIEPGESALAALSRELLEEIGIEPDLDHTEYLGSFRAVAANEPDTVIRAEVFALSSTVEPVAQGEIEELLWLDSAEAEGIELAPLTRDTILPLWESRRSALF